MERRTALITGATRGLGLAIAQTLAPDYDLLIGGRNLATIEQVADSFPSARPFACDLSDPATMPRAVAQLDVLDIVVHSAGVTNRDRVENLTSQEWSRVLNLNLIAVAELTRLLLPRLRASHGHVITINGGLGLHSGAGWSAYAASKFGLRAFSDALREEERGNLKVTSIHPGRIDTDMQRQIYESDGRAYHPADHLAPATVARAVKYALEAGDEAMVEMLQIRPNAIG
ncbi:MAG: SDR family oxidoreductase [Micropruina sp.]|nr:SDR family oxidoreductase [Micropruina sp.]